MPPAVRMAWAQACSAAGHDRSRQEPPSAGSATPAHPAPAGWPTSQTPGPWAQWRRSCRCGPCCTPAGRARWVIPHASCWCRRCQLHTWVWACSRCEAMPMMSIARHAMRRGGKLTGAWHCAACRCSSPAQHIACRATAGSCSKTPGIRAACAECGRGPRCAGFQAMVDAPNIMM